MKKIRLIIAVLLLSSLFFGCGKKQQPLEEMQQPMTMENLMTMSTTSSSLMEQDVAKPQAKALESESILGPSSEAPVKLEVLPEGPYKPTAIQIQTALKNANFYTGSIDGKIGPLSKKAIVEFQKANNLVADGKVGPKTWSVLERYLDPLLQDKAKSR
ncbi:MAG: peptidoglycan-binding domain-containing protein [Candidatus Omnitrophota bacterium]